MRACLAMVLVAAAMTSACQPGVVPHDTGFFGVRDAPRPFDGTPPLRDMGTDAFAWPDTGPQAPPVLSAQSWTMSVLLGGDVFDLTIDLDARAESGLARAVAGAAGRSGAVIFDVLPDGVLRPRNPIVMGIPGVHTCSYDALALDDFRLQFDDVDGDGVRETLTSVAFPGLVTRSGPMLSPSQIGEMAGVSDIALDETPPAISLLDPDFIPGVEPLVILASEPITPAFMPTLTGPRTVLLAPEMGAGASARWTTDTSDLPPGHYDLVLTVPADVSGLSALGPLPTLAFDVIAPAALGIDDVDSRVSGVLARPPGVIIGDDAGETPLEGATSLLVGSRTAFAIDLPAPGTHAISMVLRVAGPPGTVSSTMRVIDAHGALISWLASPSTLLSPSRTAGFEADEQPAHSMEVPFTATHAGRFFVILDIASTADPACLDGASSLGTYGVVVDSLQLI